MIHVFLHSHYADWELGYILPELVENKRPYISFGLTDRPVKSLGALQVTPDKSFSDVDPSTIELLLLPGGDFWANFQDKQFDRFVLDLHQRQVPIAAICAATGYLARLGILNHTPHTSNSLAFLKEVAPAYKGKVLYQEQLAVSEHNLITAGGFATVEFTLEVLRKLQVYSAADCEIWYRAFKFGEEPR